MRYLVRELVLKHLHPATKRKGKAFASKQNEPLRFRSGSLHRSAQGANILLLNDQRRALNALACLHGEDVVSWAHALNVQRNLLNV